MRKLASVQRITNIQSIPGKNRIALATVLGWKVIINKADFNVGDLCVYMQPDSVLPHKPQFEFLKSKDYRIKTMKMAGVYSQGICFPMNILNGNAWIQGDDVTTIIGVKQYQPGMDNDKQVFKQQKKFNLIQKIKNKLKVKDNKFPSFIHKTDETRIQTAPWLLNDKQNQYIVTQKLDGCSGTFALVKHKFLWFTKYEYIVCSRNLRLNKRDNSVYWKVSDIYLIQNALRNMIGNKEWIAIQGECLAPNIQKNKYKLQYPLFKVFNVITPQGRMGSVQAKGFVETRGLQFVPIIDEHFKLPNTAQQMLDLATGQSVIGDTLREGFVVRSKDGKTSFKAVSPAFLEYYDL